MTARPARIPSEDTAGAAAPEPVTAPTAAILVVDDEASTRDLLEQALRQRGHAVLTAESGRAALEVVRQVRCDIALVDLSMPGFDGLETIEAIRAINVDIEFIVITGHGSIESAIASLRKGVFDFLRKPFTLEEVYFSITRALERRELKERLGLFELSRTIFSTLDPEELYKRVVRSAMQVLRADDASLMLLDESGDLGMSYSSSLRPEVMSGIRQSIGERIAGRVAQQSEPVVINEDVSADGRFTGVRSIRPRFASIVCPLTMRARLLGVLNVNRVQIREKYTEHDRRNAMILSSLVALSLGNALLHKELQARLLQLEATREEVIQNEKMTALGTLMTGIAHELNNPLCSVLAYAQRLLAEGVEPKTRRGIEVIAREGERAASILARVLALARREKPEMALLAVNDVILRMLERKGNELKACRIEAKADLDPALPPVLGDFHQILAALTSLVGHAQRSMFEARGAGTLVLTTRSRDGKVVVTVSDDGPGIPSENLRRVFDPFFTAREDGRDAGLGLAPCFAIVRDHGGAIRADSSPGRGSTFVIELPVGRVAP